MEMVVNEVEVKNYYMGMKGMEVTFKDDQVRITAGTLYDRGYDYSFDEVAFDIDTNRDERIVYDLYIVENEGIYDYALDKVYFDSDEQPGWEGLGRLIHMFVTIDIGPNKEDVAEVKRIVRVEKGNDDIEIVES